MNRLMKFSLAAFAGAALFLTAGSAFATFQCTEAQNQGGCWTKGEDYCAGNGGLSSAECRVTNGSLSGCTYTCGDGMVGTPGNDVKKAAAQQDLQPAGDDGAPAKTPPKKAVKASKKGGK